MPQRGRVKGSPLGAAVGRRKAGDKGEGQQGAELQMERLLLLPGDRTGTS